MKHSQYFIAGLLFIFLFSERTVAQGFDEDFARVKYDTNYIKVYRDELTTRLFLSRKQNGLQMSDKIIGNSLNYKTNDHMLLGVGYTYSFLTINLAVKAPFLNRDDETLLKSKLMDLTTRSMFRSFLIDLYFQWSKGYYMFNPEDVYPNWNPSLDLPVRADMRTSLVGLNIQYLFNSEHFSYKASFLQNEFQKRSAGSPIVGVEGYWMLAMADSAMVPGPVSIIRYLDRDPFNQADVFNVGLNGGYAYTFVWSQTLYLSLATSFGLNGGVHQLYNSLTSETSSQGLTVGLTNLSRISLGFNSKKHYFGVSYIGFFTDSYVGNPGDWMRYYTGNIRVSFVKRFHLKRSIRALRPDLWFI